MSRRPSRKREEPTASPRGRSGKLPVKVSSKRSNKLGTLSATSLKANSWSSKLTTEVTDRLRRVECISSTHLATISLLAQDFNTQQRKSYSSWPHLGLLALVCFDFALYISYFPWNSYSDFDAFIFAMACFSILIACMCWTYNMITHRRLRRTSVDINTYREKARQSPWQATAINLAFILSSLTTCAAITVWFTYLRCCEYWAADVSTALCNSGCEGGSLPPIQVIILALLPLSYQIFLNGSNWRVVLFLWSISFLTILLSVFALGQYTSASFMLICITLLIGILMAEIRRQQHDCFEYFISEMKLMEDLLLSKFKVEDERNRSLELRKMIGNIAHDVKSPLSSLRLGLDSLLSSLIRKEYSMDISGTDSVTCSVKEEIEICRELESTFAFMSMTIGRACDFERTNKGFTLSPDLQYVHLDPIVTRMLNCCHGMKNNVDIKVAPISRMMNAKFHTDESWLFDNLLCLVSNAVKFTDNDTVHVRFALKRDPVANKVMLRTEVEDAGPGIPEEARESVFNLFNEGQKKVGGSGLGLYCLSRRVHALGGSYGVKDREGECFDRGLVFWFEIPFVTYRKRGRGEAPSNGPAASGKLRSVRSNSPQPPSDDGSEASPMVSIRSRRHNLGSPNYRMQMQAPDMGKKQLSLISSRPSSIKSNTSAKAKKSIKSSGFVAPSGSSKSSWSTKDKKQTISSEIVKNVSAKISGLFQEASNDVTFSPIQPFDDVVISDPHGNAEKSNDMDQSSGISVDSIRVLIIGHDHDVIRMLLSLGHHVDFAESGMVAYEILQARNFDAVIISPEIRFNDTLIFLQKFRYIERNRPNVMGSQLIIALLLSNDNADGDTLLSGGADEVLYSPFSAVELDLVIANRDGQVGDMSLSLHYNSLETEEFSAPNADNNVNTRVEGAVGRVHRRSLDAMEILVVDDSITILTTLKRTLKNAKYEVTTAENGAIALELMLQHRFDAVLIDQQMPIMDGPECVRKFREVESERPRNDSDSRYQLIVGMSANTDDDCKEVAFKSGVDFFVQKPFPLHRLQEILKQYYAIDSYDAAEI